MRQLFPESRDDVDAIEVYAGDDRSRSPERPWMMLNMIAGIDGAISIAGVSGGLGGPADAAVFGAIRAVADVILVGAGTVIAENYRRPQTPPSVQELRLARGQAPMPTVAIVSNSLSVPPDHRVFEGIAGPRVPGQHLVPVEPVRGTRREHEEGGNCELAAVGRRRERRIGRCARHPGDPTRASRSRHSWGRFLRNRLPSAREAELALSLAHS